MRSKIRHSLGIVVLVSMLAVLAAPQAFAAPPRQDPTATPPPLISGFPAASESEAKTAQAAFDAGDKGQPDPAWKGKKFTIGVYSAGQRGAISGPVYFWRNKFE